MAASPGIEMAMEDEEQERLAEKLTVLQTEPSDAEGKMDHENGAYTILVCGLDPSTTDECVEFFFENTRRSGGGPIERVERLEETKALVCFRNKEDAESVVKKGQLKLDGHILHTSEFHPGDGCLATSGASSETSNMAVPDLSGILLSQTESTELDKPANSVDDNEDLNPDSQLKTEALTRKQSIPNLTLYQLKFLNNPKVLEQVYRECPDVEVCVDISAQTAHVKAPESLIDQTCVYVQKLLSAIAETRLTFTPALFKMHEREEHRAWIQRSMIDHLDLLCHWEIQDQSLIIVAQNSSLLLLQQLFRSLFVEIKVHLETWEVSLLKSSWTSFLEVFQKDGDGCPTPVLVLENDSVTIVDTPSSISQTQLSVRQFLDKHRNLVILSSAGDEGDSLGEELCDSHVVRVIPNLKAGQLKVLSSPAVLERWYRDYPDLHISVDQEKKTVVVKAVENTMKKAFVELMYFVTMIREVKVQLGPALVKMFEKKSSKRWIQRVLVEKNEPSCHWELHDQNLVISGQSSDLFHLEQTFKAFFMEVTVHLEEWEVNLLSSNVWTSFVERRSRGRGETPEPVLLLENTQVVIVDLPENVIPTQQALKQFLNEHHGKVTDLPGVDSSPVVQGSSLWVENCIPCLRPDQLSFLSKPKALDKLCKQHSGLTIHVDRDRKTAVVRAPENIMQEAFADVLCYVTRIKETEIPLSQPFVQMFGRNENKEWVQQSLIDKFELLCHWEVHDEHLIISAQSASLPRLEQMFKSLFKEVKIHLDEKEIMMLTPSVWSSFVEKQQMARDDSPTPVLLFDGDCVTIIDIPTKVNTTQQALRHLLDEQRHHESSSSDIMCKLIAMECTEQRTISNLEPGQLKVLSLPAVLSKLSKSHPGLQISVDKETETAVITAPGNVIEEAFIDVLSSVCDVRELKVPLSPALYQMFEKKDCKQWIQNTLIDCYELVCHWELGNQHLIICAQNSSLLRLEQLFKSVFKEVKVNLKEWEAGTLTPPVWRSFVRGQEINRKGSPSPIMLLETDTATIVDVTAKVKDTQLALVQLLNDLVS